MRAIYCFLLTMVFLANTSMAAPRIFNGNDLLAQKNGEPQSSPCDDPRYFELQKKSLDDMSQREYEYFKNKEEECAKYRQLLLMQGAQTEEMNQQQPLIIQQPQEHKGMSTGGIVALSVLATFGTLLIIGLIASGD